MKLKKQSKQPKQFAPIQRLIVGSAVLGQQGIEPNASIFDIYQITRNMV